MSNIKRNQWEDSQMKDTLKAQIKEIRDSMEFYERLVIFKTNRRMNLSNPGYEPIARLPRESFVDYVLRVRQAFPPDHPLPRLRIRK